MQAIVKELAEANGLRAAIAAPLPTSGQVDVLIERDGILAAIEISVSTPVEHEKLNVRKCLNAGSPRIAVVLAKSKRTRANYHAVLVEGLNGIEHSKVSFLSPEEAPDFIIAITPPSALGEKIIKGHQVKTSRTVGTPEEIKARQEALARVFARSMDR